MLYVVNDVSFEDITQIAPDSEIVHFVFVTAVSIYDNAQ